MVFKICHHNPDLFLIKFFIPIFSYEIYNYLELCQVDKFLSNFAQRNHENGYLHS